jgi:hypothetical protein
MSAAYWMQWDHAEIAALHGAYEIDEDEIDLDLEQSEQEEQVSLPYDLDMLTARDFL